jgi:hypothetical protein
LRLDGAAEGEYNANEEQKILLYMKLRVLARKKQVKKPKPICIISGIVSQAQESRFSRTPCLDTMNASLNSPKRPISPCPCIRIAAHIRCARPLDPCAPPLQPRMSNSRAYPAMWPPASASSKRAPMHIRSCAKLVPSNCTSLGNADADDGCCVSEEATEPTDDGSRGPMLSR